MPKISWKKYVKEKVTNGAFKYLVEENMTKDKTKHITFSELKMGQYLTNNKKTSVTKIIFHTRSKTLEIKVWAHWKFKNDLCVACKNAIETMCHFMNCTSYQSEPYSEWSKKKLLCRTTRGRHSYREKIYRKDWHDRNTRGWLTSIDQLHCSGGL